MQTQSLFSARPNPVLTARDMSGDPRVSAPGGQAPKEQTNAAKPYEVGPISAGAPLAAVLLIVLLLFAVRLTLDGAHHVAGKDKTVFREVDVTFWNGMIIALFAMIGIPIWKFLGNRFLNDRNPVRLYFNAV